MKNISSELSHWYSREAWCSGDCDRIWELICNEICDTHYEAIEQMLIMREEE